MTDQICFRVLGDPIPKGSMKAFFRPGMRFPVVTHDNKRMKPWADHVKSIAQDHAPAGGPWTGPLQIDTTFYLTRPKSLPKKVVMHTKKPDLDKLVRAVKDALKGIVYVDDSQVCQLQATKDYATGRLVPGVIVLVRHLTETAQEAKP